VGAVAALPHSFALVADGIPVVAVPPVAGAAGKRSVPTAVQKAVHAAVAVVMVIFFYS